MRHAMRLAATVAVISVALAGCGGSASIGASDAGTPQATPVSPSSSASSSVPAAGLDLRAANWNDVTVPGRACRQSQPVRLLHGKARIPDPRGYPDHPGGRRYYNLQAPPNGIFYGDLEGGGASDAALPLQCDNNGGTADGQLLFSIAVFSGSGGTRHLLGLITPRIQPKGVHVTIVGTFNNAVVISTGRLLAREVFYGTHDPTCCPSGRATTTWNYHDGRLQPGPSRVTHPAR